jgi:hypothetical protein
MHNCVHCTIASVHSHGEGEYDHNSSRMNALSPFALMFAGEWVINEVRARRVHQSDLAHAETMPESLWEHVISCKPSEL